MSNCTYELIFPDSSSPFADIGYLHYGNLQPDSGMRFEWVPRNVSEENWGLNITMIGNRKIMHDLGDMKAIIATLKLIHNLPAGKITGF